MFRLLCPHTSSLINEECKAVRAATVEVRAQLEAGMGGARRMGWEEYSCHYFKGNQETLNILIFDCCKGNIKKELNEADEDTMEVDAEDLPNSY